ncbi:MAG: cation transporter, partial [Planctomycetes bacterium]|nr:cation transporter [Planctomycetota bacterium]
MPSRLSQGRRAIIVGLAVNSSLAFVKLLAGLAGHSYALVADAVESFSDMLSS